MTVPPGPPHAHNSGSEVANVSPFEAFGVDVRFGTTKDGRVFAIMGDLARLLGHRDAANAGRMLDEDEKGTQIVSTPGGDQRVSVAYEDGIWELIFRSQVKGAKAIKKRVKEILASLRRGEIAVPAPRELSRLELIDLAREAEVGRLEEKAGREIAEERVAELAPKAAAADALMESEGTVSMGAVANAFEIGRTELFKMLRAEKILQKDRRPYQEYTGWFRVAIKHYDDSNGVQRPFVNTRMYPAGALRLHALLTKRGRELRKPVFDAQLSLLSGGAA